MGGGEIQSLLGHLARAGDEKRDRVEASGPEQMRHEVVQDLQHLGAHLGLAVELERIEEEGEGVDRQIP